MTGDETVEVAAGQAETCEVVPAAHSFAGRGEAGHLAEDFEQAVVVQVQKDGMIFFKLPFHRAGEELDIRIRESLQRSSDGYRASASSRPGWHNPGSIGNGGCGGGCFRK